MTNSDKQIFDWSAVGISAATFWEVLPAATAVLSLIWISLRIYQTIMEIRDRRKKD
jgi:hypothetical protein